jgi:DNA invertase Pin-like site-specific DNA recombinase
MKVSIYARESSDDTKKAPPIEKQIEIGKQWILQKNYELVNIFQDNGYSGGDWNRPSWLQSINDAKRHQYQILWVWNQDRIARDTEQFLFFYRNLTTAKIKIFDYSINDFINMDDLGGRVKHTTMAQASEIFRLVTSDKVKAKYRSKIDNKEYDWGRPKKKPNIEIIIKLKNEGLGFREIAKKINKTISDKKQQVSYQTIRRLLQNTPNNFISQNKQNNEVLQNNPIL